MPGDSKVVTCQVNNILCSVEYTQEVEVEVEIKSTPTNQQTTQKMVTIIIIVLLIVVFITAGLVFYFCCYRKIVCKKGRRGNWEPPKEQNSERNNSLVDIEKQKEPESINFVNNSFPESQQTVNEGSQQSIHASLPSVSESISLLNNSLHDSQEPTNQPSDQSPHESLRSADNEVEDVTRPRTPMELTDDEKSMMFDVNNRRHTFRPWLDNMEDIPKKQGLVRAGFFYKGPEHNVQCPECKLEIQVWRKGDDPVKKHLDLSEACSLARKANEDDMVEHSDKPEDMDDLKNRLLTFTSWPYERKQSKVNLAEAGFYFIGPKDRVKCFSCNRKVHGWLKDDDPVGEHKRISKYCDFINR